MIVITSLGQRRNKYERVINITRVLDPGYSADPRRLEFEAMRGRLLTVYTKYVFKKLKTVNKNERKKKENAFFTIILKEKLTS